MRDQKAQSCNKELKWACMYVGDAYWNTNWRGPKPLLSLQPVHAALSPYAATSAVLAVAAPKGFPPGSPSGKPVSGKELPLVWEGTSRKWHEQSWGRAFHTLSSACSLLMSAQLSSLATFFISPFQQLQEDRSITSSAKVTFFTAWELQCCLKTEKPFLSSIETFSQVVMCPF